MATSPRRKSVAVNVGNVKVGGAHPIVVQSMTNTDTADVQSTVNQVMALAQAGSELVRVTVNTDDAARAVPKIAETLYTFGVRVPIVGDFHYLPLQRPSVVAQVSGLRKGACQVPHQSREREYR